MTLWLNRASQLPSDEDLYYLAVANFKCTHCGARGRRQRIIVARYDRAAKSWRTPSGKMVLGEVIGWKVRDDV